MHAAFHVLRICVEHMLSWSPRADIEDGERQYFKENVFPEVRLPQPIQLTILTSLPWTNKCWDLHTRKGQLTNWNQLRISTLNRMDHMSPPKNGSFHQISLEEMHNHTGYSTCTCGCACSYKYTLLQQSWSWGSSHYRLFISVQISRNDLSVQHCVKNCEDSLVLMPCNNRRQCIVGNMNFHLLKARHSLHCLPLSQQH